MKKMLPHMLKAVMISGSLISLAPASHAESGRIAAGVAGGLLGGMLLGGALASGPVYAAPPPPPPVYYPPARVYLEEPDCRLVRQQYWDGYGYRLRRVQVCD